MQGPSSYFPAGQSYVFPNEIKDLHDSDYELYHPIPAHGASTPLRMGIEEAKPVAALDVSHAAGEEEDQLLHLLQHHLPVQVPAVAPSPKHRAQCQENLSNAGNTASSSFERANLLVALENSTKLIDVVLAS